MYEVGDMIVITDDIIEDGKIYLGKNTKCEIVGVFDNSYHIRVDEHFVLYLEKVDPFVTLEEHQRLVREGKLSDLID
jgi:hypothetical protein